jgi:hypothetical protein
MNLRELLFMLDKYVTIDGELYPLSFCRTGVVTHPSGDDHEIYIFRAITGGRPKCKVGMAKHSARRLQSLQTSTPVPLELWRSWTVPRYSAVWVERTAHSLLARKRLHGEWFEVRPYTATSAVRKAIRHIPKIRKFYHDSLYLRPEWKAAVKDYKNH